VFQGKEVEGGTVQEKITRQKPRMKNVKRNLGKNPLCKKKGGERGGKELQEQLIEVLIKGRGEHIG